MDDTFDIPVIYKNKQLIFNAKLLQSGYSYKFEVDLNGSNVLFEPDEERNFRAIIDPSIEHGRNKINIELIKLIVKALVAIIG